MTTMYHIEIYKGKIEFQHHSVGRLVTNIAAPNSKRYFEHRGMKKPKPVVVRGWPFKKMYITHGTEEHGFAVAWAD